MECSRSTAGHRCGSSRSTSRRAEHCSGRPNPKRSRLLIASRALFRYKREPLAGAVPDFERATCDPTAVEVHQQPGGAVHLVMLQRSQHGLKTPHEKVTKIGVQFIGIEHLTEQVRCLCPQIGNLIILKHREDAPLP
jgi:hypothetical protein